jgi:hypothetical protein
MKEALQSPCSKPPNSLPDNNAAIAGSAVIAGNEKYLDARHVAHPSYSSPLTAHRLLLTAHCLLLTAYRSRFPSRPHQLQILLN